VFLMDEPLSNLDAKLRTQTRGEIKRLQHAVRTTTVYVTHDQVEAMTMGDRIAVMNDGVLEQVGTPEELYERPANRFVAGFIGSPAMSFFTASAAAEDGAVRLRGAAIDLRLPGAPELPAEVAVGVRPEGARLWRDGGGLIGPLRGTVAYVEALGRETFVGVDVGEARLAIYEEGRTALQPGDDVEFGVLAEGLRFFSSESGEAVGASRGRSLAR
jgi:ABC-type sugar transport system ATPase subunit